MKKNFKLEKKFYSEKNFKILEEVLLEIVDKNKLNDNYKLFIFNSMEQSFNNIKIPENLNTKDNKKYLTLLNKQVISNIVSNSQSQNNPQHPQSHIQQQSQHPQSHIQQQSQHPQSHNQQNIQQQSQHPQSHNQQNIQQQSQSIQQYKEVKPFQSFETSTINSTQFSIFPETKNRDLQTFYSRNFTPPVANPILHPNKQIENFPPPQQDRTQSNNTKKMFSKIEEERNNEKNIKKPPQIDFTLPLNTKENINHENKFQELIKKREIDDITLNKDLNTDKNILNSNKINNSKTNSYIQEINNSKTNSYIQEINNSKTNSYIQEIDNSKTNSYIQEINNSKTNSYIQEIDNSKTNSYIQEIDNSKTNSYKIHQEIDNSFFSNKNSNIEYNSMVDGLDENLLNMDDIIDTPHIKHPNMSNQIPERHNNQIPEKIEKTIYLTILSKYRNTDKYPSPTNFTLSLKNKESNIVKLSDEILFKETFPDEHNEFILNDIININNIISIECLDVVIPKNNFILQEPYLWLCINEWSSSNIGTGVPNGAFARLKPISFDKESPYITLRPHILERQSPLKMSDTLTLKIVTSDGEEIDIEDRVELKTIQSLNNNICLETDKNIKENDLIYIYSLYDDVIGFYPNVYIHNLTLNKLKQNISFRLFLDKDANISDNKIGKFIDKDTKIRIIASKYLSVGDLFVIDIDKETNKYKILDIKDDIITIDYKKNIKKISRIGFIKQKKEGYSSKNKQDIHYKSGVQIKNVDVSESISKLHLKNYTFDNTNKYFFLQRNKQISYMFRITNIES
jgi:hypothetical protein